MPGGQTLRDRTWVLRGGCGLFWVLWWDRELCDFEAAANWLATEKGSCKSHVTGMKVSYSQTPGPLGETARQACCSPANAL